MLTLRWLVSSLAILSMGSLAHADFEMRVKSRQAGQSPEFRTFAMVQSPTCTRTIQYEPRRLSKVQAELVMGTLKDIEYPRSSVAGLDQCLGLSFSSSSPAQTKKTIELCREKWDKALKLVQTLPRPSSKEDRQLPAELASTVELARARQLAAVRYASSEKLKDLSLGSRGAALERQCHEVREKVADSAY